MTAKKVIAIIEHVAEFVTKIEINSCKLTTIRLGSEIYNVRMLKMDNFLQAIAKNEPDITEANIYLESRFFDLFVKSNPNLKKLVLVDQMCDYSFVEDEFPFVEDLTLVQNKTCPARLKQVIWYWCQKLEKKFVVLLK